MNDNRKYTTKVSLRISMDAYEEDDVIDVISDLFAPGEMMDGITIETCEIGSIQEDERR